MPDTAPSPFDSEPSSGAFSRAVADELYDFALTLTWDPDVAAATVITAIDDPELPATPSRTDLYAAVHRTARSQVVEPPPAPVDLSSEPSEGIGSEVVETLALGVIDRLTSDDRALLDLVMRKGFEGEDLARVLGVPTHEVADLVASRRFEDDRILRNYVLARVGVDACPRLVEALPDGPTDLRDLADLVDEHVADCSICDDRRRGLMAPTSLFTSIPARPAPESVAEHFAGRGELETSIEETTPPGPSWRRVALISGLVVVALAAVFFGARIFRGSNPPAVEEPPTGLLSAGTRRVDFGSDANLRTVAIRNSGGGSATFTTKVDVPWLTVTPTKGTLEPGGATDLTLALDRSNAPEGKVLTTIRVVSAGGILEVDASAQVARNPVISKVQSAAPEISASPCPDATTSTRITATVVEDSGLQSVVLHWSGVAIEGGATQGQVAMTGNGDRYEIVLGPFSQPGTVTWDIEATDTNGNVGRSDPQHLAVTACAPATSTTTG